MVQSFGLGTGVLATGRTVGVEPETRTGASAPATAGAHDRVCPRHCGHSRDGSEAGTTARLWHARRRLALESGALLWARLHPPARRRAALSGGQDVAPHRAAPGSGWQFARALQCQNPRLSRLLKAPAVSVAWGCHDKAASDQSSPASPPGRSRAAPLARLEPKRAPTCLSATRARPTGRGEHAAHTTTRRGSAQQRGRDPFPRAAGAHASLVGDAPGSQQAARHVWPSHVQALRRPQRLRAPSGPDGGLERTRSHRVQKRGGTGCFSRSFCMAC